MDDHVGRWVTSLAAQDSVFAEASRLRPVTDRAWQSGVYLLSADRDLWSHFGSRVAEERSLDVVVVEALALFGYDQGRSRSLVVTPERWWRPIQTDLLVWASFCWTDQWFNGPTAVPRSLPTALYERWLSALWIQKDHTQRPGLL